MTFVIIVVQGVVYIGIIAAMIVYMVRRRHPKEEEEHDIRVRAKVLRKDVGSGQAYSIAKQYMSEQTTFSVTFDLGRSVVSLYAGAVFFDMLEPGETGWLTYEQGRITDFESDQERNSTDFESDPNGTVGYRPLDFLVF